jgi:hypothetical protein
VRRGLPAPDQQTNQAAVVKTLLAFLDHTFRRLRITSRPVTCNGSLGLSARSAVPRGTSSTSGDQERSRRVNLSRSRAQPTVSAAPSIAGTAKRHQNDGRVCSARNTTNHSGPEPRQRNWNAHQILERPHLFRAEREGDHGDDRASCGDPSGTSTLGRCDNASFARLR